MVQALEEMRINSMKRATTRRMYLMGLFRKVTGNAKTNGCNKIETKMVAMTAPGKPELRNFLRPFGCHKMEEVIVEKNTP